MTHKFLVSCKEKRCIKHGCNPIFQEKFYYLAYKEYPSEIIFCFERLCYTCSVSHVNVNEGVSNGPNISLEMFDRTGWKEEKLIVVVCQ